MSWIKIKSMVFDFLIILINHFLELINQSAEVELDEEIKN